MLERRGMLIVSLPANDVALARAAVENGADMLKVHLNVYHHAAQRSFGTLRENQEVMEEILALGVPVGIVPGEEETISREEALSLKAMGFAFLDAYIFAIRPYFYDLGLPVVPAYYPELPESQLAMLRYFPGDWLEAAVVPKSGYGAEMRLEDLLKYRLLAEITGRRLIVPSQRKLQPEDVKYLFENPFVYAVMIGAVVTGQTEESLGKATARFRKSIDQVMAGALNKS